MPMGQLWGLPVNIYPAHQSYASKLQPGVYMMPQPMVASPGTLVYNPPASSPIQAMNKPFIIQQHQWVPERVKDHLTKTPQEPVPTDRPFSSDWNWLDKTFLCLKTFFITTPKTVWKGLKGDKSFSFSESMLLAKIPYYIGGAALASSFLLGGNKREGLRQSVAVISYLLGLTAVNKSINAIYKHRWGIDLDRKYKSKFGLIEPMYASVDFARFDLLSSEDYGRMAQKMGIPKNVHDREGAVQEQIKYAIARSRTMKLLLGYCLSAVGAGYLARTDAWLSMPDKLRTVPAIWKNGALGLGSKLGQSIGVLYDALKTPLAERLSLTGASAWRKATVVGSTAALVAGLGYVLGWGVKSKRYDTSISPADWHDTEGIRHQFEDPLAPLQSVALRAMVDPQDVALDGRVRL